MQRCCTGSTAQEELEGKATRTAACWYQEKRLVHRPARTAGEKLSFTRRCNGHPYKEGHEGSRAGRTSQRLPVSSRRGLELLSEFKGSNYWRKIKLPGSGLLAVPSEQVLSAQTLRVHCPTKPAGTRHLSYQPLHLR